jgi:hypothetical protein
MTGCGTGTSTGTGEGNLTISLTDAPGDFSVYAVDVTSISLTKPNGVEVETLPLTTTVDFSQYVDMTEFVSAGTVPSGEYTKGSMTLDFTSATIQVEDPDGNPATVGQFVDTDGGPVTTMKIGITLDNKNALTIAPGIPSHLSIDFDLKASNSVDFTDPDNPVLTIDPVLVAEVNIERDKPHRVRGPLESVDTDASSYRVILRPFLHKQSNDTRFGELDVITDSETVFDIDGASYVGSEGITAMAALSRLSATRAIGNFKMHPRRFMATQVLAGSSVEGGDQDVVRGTVIARNDDTLTIQGATLIRTDGSFSFNSKITVLIADSTQVKKQLSTTEHHINAISIGQRIAMFGTMTDLTEESMVLDATNGTARLLQTAVRGNVAEQVDPGTPELAVDLHSINRRRVSLFDFSGTGVHAANDADAAYYQIDTGTLDFSQFTVGTPMLARGFITPFGAAPKDFEAQTLVNFQALPANLVVIWRPAAVDAFESIDNTGLILDLSDSDKFHHLSQGGMQTDLTTLAGPIEIKPDSSTDGAYVITEHSVGRVVHDRFEAFAEDLQHRLNNEKTTRKVHAHGEYDAGTQEFVSSRIWVELR